MATIDRRRAVLDTSVLINCLVVNRADLLTDHPTHWFVVTDHMTAEVLDRDSGQVARLQAVLAPRALEHMQVDEPAAVEIFVSLQRTNRLGVGECAAAALAVAKDWSMATVDARAQKILARLHPRLRFLNTAEIIRAWIQSGRLSVDHADTIKHALETQYRFRLPFKSFGDCV